jgi:prepilin-type N-terminal cleavage/methylation domain-containing protein
MNNELRTKRCFTLVEMLVVVAIVVVLASLVIGITLRIENREKEKQCRSAIALLATALAQFHDYGFTYSDPNYSALTFPLDCNNFAVSDIQTTLLNALGTTTVQISGGVHDPNYSSDEVMYLFLSMVPTSRQTLEKIDKKLVTNLGSDKQPMAITIVSGGNAKVYPLLRVIDPWGTTLRYDYYDKTTSLLPDPTTKRTFPLITSAGPDGIFGTSDDITSRQ